jgi:hypothetical protein
MLWLMRNEIFNYYLFQLMLFNFVFIKKNVLFQKKNTYQRIKINFIIY